MPKRTYYLDKEKTQTVQLKWGFFFSNLTITINNAVIGQIKNIAQLRKGQIFILANGQEFFVRLIGLFTRHPDLEILFDGKPLPDSATHPDNILKYTYWILMFLAFINVGLGAVAIAEELNLFTLDYAGRWKRVPAVMEDLRLFHFFEKGGVVTFFAGIATGIFAYFIKYRYSMIALITFILLLFIDAILIGQMHGWPELEFEKTGWRGQYRLAGVWSFIFLDIIVSLCLVACINVLRRKKRETGN